MKIKGSVILLLLISFNIFSQVLTESGYSQKIEEAIKKENYETAINLLKEAESFYPDNADFNLRLGNLFFMKSMYSIALDEYLKAELKNPENTNTLDKIQLCYNYLNDYENCILYLKKILEINPDAVYSIDDLSWMYYKTYKFEQGIDLLLDAIEKYGFRRNLSMKLATLYFGMYQYDLSKQYYLEAIIDALVDTASDYNSEFAAIGYYNLSLLEKRFYKYDLALEYTNEALNQLERATGHLSKGNLYQSRMNFHYALEEYQNAYLMDETPLSKINLAGLFLDFGFLNLAKEYAEEVYTETDHSWIHSFGMDKTEHYQEIHELLRDIYSGMSNRAFLYPVTNIFEKLSNLSESVYYNTLSYYHKQKYKLYTMTIALANIREGNFLDAYWQLYLVNRDYPDTALKYLDKAREIKTELIPHSDSFYTLEEGKVTNNPELILEALNNFDPYWEKEAVADSLVTLAGIYKKGTEKYRNVLNRLYRINPGAFIQNGFGLPLEIRFDNSVPELEIADLLMQAGFELRPETGKIQALNDEYQFKLIISESSYKIVDLTTMRAIKQRYFDKHEENKNLKLVMSIIEDIYYIS